MFKVSLGPRHSYGTLVVNESAPGGVRIESVAVPADRDARIDIALPPIGVVSGHVRSTQGEPIGGAAVEVIVRRAVGPRHFAFFATTRSADDGHFSVAAPEGIRTIAVQVPGFAPYEREMDGAASAEVIEIAGAARVTGVVLMPTGAPAAGAVVRVATRCVTADANGSFQMTDVAPGRHTIHASFRSDLIARHEQIETRAGSETAVSLALADGAVLRGRVRDSKTRRLVPGAVVVVGPTPIDRASARNRVVLTDEAGAFEMRGLPPETLTVTAVDPRYLETSIANVDTSAGSPRALDMVLTPAASLSGRVVGPNAEPLAGAWLRVRGGSIDLGRLAGWGQLNADALADYCVASDENGRFELDALPPVSGGAVLEARKPGFPSTQIPIRLTTGQRLKNLVVTVRRPHSATGRVVTAEGTPIAGAKVAIRAVDASATWSPEDKGRGELVTGVDGRFLMRMIDPGAYSLAASAQGFAPRIVNGLTAPGGQDSVWPDTVLTPGVSLNAIVQTSDGLPVAGARCRIFGRNVLPAEVLSDQTGTLVFDNLPPGEEVIATVEADNYATAELFAEPPCDPLTFVLMRSATISGIVRDAETGEPVDIFSVGRRKGGPIDRGHLAAGAKEVRSPEGRFLLEGVSPGTWTVLATARGYRPAITGDIELAEGEHTDLAIDLARGRTILGRVIASQDNQAVAGATISCCKANTGADRAGEFGAAIAATAAANAGNPVAQSDSQGDFVLNGAPDGGVVLTVTHSDYVTGSVRVSAEDDRILVSLNSGGEIAGLVVEAGSGSPVAAASLTLEALGSSDPAFAFQADQSASDGTFSFRQLVPGRYLLRSQSSKGSGTPRDVYVTTRDVQQVVVEVSPGTRLTGTLSGIPPEQLGGVNVNAIVNGVFESGAVSSPTGAFEFMGVPSGAVRVTATTQPPNRRSATSTINIDEGQLTAFATVEFRGASQITGVVRRNSLPQAGVTVQALAVHDPGLRYAARTGRQGEYSIDGVEDGTYTFSVIGSGRRFSSVVEVTGNATQDFDLPAVSIRGTVTDSSSDAPLEGATIQIVEAPPGAAVGARSLSTSTGAFELPDVISGEYRLITTRSGYSQRAASISVADDGPDTTVSVALERSTGIPVHAVDGMVGLPLGGVHILAWTTDGRLASSAVVQLDDEGRGELPLLSPGRYSVRIFSAGYAAAQVPSLIIPGGEIDVALLRGGFLDLHTPTATSIWMIDGAGSLMIQTPWRLDGRIDVLPPSTLVANIQPGRYRVVDIDGATLSEVQIVDGATATIALTTPH